MNNSRMALNLIGTSAGAVSLFTESTPMQWLMFGIAAINAAGLAVDLVSKALVPLVHKLRQAARRIKKSATEDIPDDDEEVIDDDAEK